MTSDTTVRYFQFADYRLAFRVLGNGPLVMLAFHGFGQDSGVFIPLQSTVGHRYTTYAIDLFFHGESHFATTQTLPKQDWQMLVEAFLKAHTINRFSLLGFSLGGRFALTIAEQYAHRLDQLILIAPDGITRSFWYTLATGSIPGRWLLKQVLNHLAIISQLGHILTKIRLLHRTVIRFAEVSLATPAQRHQVYLSWTLFRLISPDLSVLATQLNRESVRVRFFTGYFDQIVPSRYIDPLTQQLHAYEQTVLKAGHNRLIDQVAHLL